MARKMMDLLAIDDWGGGGGAINDKGKEWRLCVQ
jgi:hypothetical protein